MAEVWGVVGRVGPYFDVRTGAVPPAGFRPLRELYAAGADGPLAGRIGQAARQLGTREPRVAASVVHLGLASRLWSVALGAAAIGGIVPDLHPDRAHGMLPAQGAFELWLPDRPSALGGSLADGLRQAVAVENLAPLAEAVRSVVPVAERLLEGNAASALVGAGRVLAAAPSVRHTEAARHTAELVRALLGAPPLVGTGTVTAPDRALAFRRTSCCLYYRVPGGGVCGDCVFDRPPGTR
ncbi:(2Fe-2S)-binding protein [Kitasatospora sp. DSM 101779]|uniref:(2Fe-2S)-binding protein n=1 Tax=Kitasatospora sp. DSM 101779 TaxID=2853165 RepID=UPI0021D9394C|nr:(2Fe-2S)-binding protein [Kitasatospora sp. DSM 101779]MCU7820606.1 (2Fe-2S)-binding protein [Kitasatospora sp. DSM 101779]